MSKTKNELRRNATAVDSEAGARRARRHVRGESARRGDPGSPGRRANSAGGSHGAGRGFAALLPVGNPCLAGVGGRFGAAAQGPSAFARRAHCPVGKGARSNPAARMHGSRRWCVPQSAAWGSSRRRRAKASRSARIKAGRRQRRPTVRALKGREGLGEGLCCGERRTRYNQRNSTDRFAESAPPGDGAPQSGLSTLSQGTVG